MKDEKFGKIIDNGKMVDLDSSSVDELENIATNLKQREDDLKKKIITVFNQ